MKNTRYKIYVEDPYGFKGSSGENHFLGEIIKVVSPRMMIFKSDSHLEFGNVKSDLFVFKIRHEGRFFDSRNKYEESINAGILPGVDIQNLNYSQIEKIAQFVFIGSLECLD